MPVRKIAISLSAELLREADRLARRQGKSRSAFIQGLIARAAQEAHDREITEQLNRVFSDPRVRREQRRMTREVFRGEVFGDPDDQWE